MNVAIYARLSKDTSGISENVDFQIRECKAYARSMGYKITGIFSDNDVGASEYSRKPRPGYQTLLIVVRANQVDAILITETARLYRRLDELLELIRLAARTSHAAPLRGSDAELVPRPRMELPTVASGPTAMRRVG